MPGFMPGIHALMGCRNEGVDGRDKPGHDKQFMNAGDYRAETFCGFASAVSGSGLSG